MNSSKPPLLVHVIYHLDIGGLENGLVNLINHIPPDRYQHAIICLKGYTDFYQRINRKDVKIIALNKKEGHDPKLYLNLLSDHQTLLFLLFCFSSKFILFFDVLSSC